MLQVDDDATQIVVGMFIIGHGKAWIDHVRFEEVDDDTPTTGHRLPTPRRMGGPRRRISSKDDDDSDDEKPTRGGFYQQSDVLAKLQAEAEFSP